MSELNKQETRLNELDTQIISIASAHDNTSVTLPTTLDSPDSPADNEAVNNLNNPDKPVLEDTKSVLNNPSNPSNPDSVSVRERERARGGDNRGSSSGSQANKLDQFWRESMAALTGG